MAKYNKGEAQECLTSLQMIGEGWWRSANLSLNMGAHLALGMTPREFVLSIGRQQTLDATDAILEMKAEGVSIKRIVAITGVSDASVNMILAGWRGKGNPLAEPRIAITATIQKQLDTGMTLPNRKDYAPMGGSAGETAHRSEILDAVVVDPDSYESQISDMADQIAELTQQVKVQKKKVSETSSKNAKMSKQHYIEAERRYMTPEKKEELRERVKQEMDEEGAELLKSFSILGLKSVLQSLEHAQEGIQELRRDGHLDQAAWTKIQSAFGNLSEEMNISQVGLRVISSETNQREIS